MADLLAALHPEAEIIAIGNITGELSEIKVVKEDDI